MLLAWLQCTSAMHGTCQPWPPCQSPACAQPCWLPLSIHLDWHASLLTSRHQPAPRPTFTHSCSTPCSRDDRDEERLEELRALNRATKEETGEYMSPEEIAAIRPPRWTGAWRAAGLSSLGFGRSSELGQLGRCGALMAGAVHHNQT